MEPGRIQAVDHVELEAPLGTEDALRWFYGELAELDEVAASGLTGGPIRFKSARIELRIRFVPRPSIDPVPVRVTIGVRSILETRAKLDEARIPFERVSGLLFTDRRIQVLDPAGNRVAFRQVWDVGAL